MLNVPIVYKNIYIFTNDDINVVVVQIMSLQCYSFYCNVIVSIYNNCQHCH